MSQTLHTRRHFIKTSFLGGAAAWTIPAFLERTFFALDAIAAEAVLPTPTGRDHPILVVLQLAGGNDGLNTVIPHADDAYYRARPQLAIPTGQSLKIDDRIGLHPALTGLRGLYDAGDAAIIQGVGYPNPNRSHFRSTDIWQTATDAERVSSRGWLGRYFDACCSGEDPGVGVAIGERDPLAFASAHPQGITFNSPEKFRLEGDAEMVMDAIGGGADPGDSSEGASIGALAGSSTDAGDTADFLRRVALDAQLSSHRVQEITSRFPLAAAFPKSRLGHSLGLVARLIAGGMPTRVYYVSQGGFDTHNAQSATHERLLREFDAALAAFVAELRAMKVLDRVLLMTFSEFGRRVAENANGGTDHGAAAPMFLVGGGIQPGLHGAAPSLTHLDRGDLIHTTDFRSVYATLLEGWLHAPADRILEKKFPRLPLLAAGVPAVRHQS